MWCKWTELGMPNPTDESLCHAENMYVLHSYFIAIDIVPYAEINTKQ